jgi:DNA-binding beta-propeller fold protein YncE
VGAGVAARSSPGLYTFSHLVVRPATGRAYVCDSGPRVLEVDLLTGDRSIASDATHGVGTALPSSTSSMVVDAGDGQIYLASTSTKIVGLDLSSGDRTELSPGAGSGTVIARCEDLAIDAAANLLYVYDSSARVLVVMDLGTLVRTTLSSAAVGSGPTLPSFGELAVDPAAGRAFLCLPDEVFAVDLATGNRSILSDDVTGRGRCRPTSAT